MTAPELPGAALVERGLQDLAVGITSVESLLVSIGAPGLRSVGVEVPTPLDDADLRLYDALAQEYGDDAHARYNALVHLLVSFRRAACVR